MKRILKRKIFADDPKIEWVRGRRDYTSEPTIPEYNFNHGDLVIENGVHRAMKAIKMNLSKIPAWVFFDGKKKEKMMIPLNPKKIYAPPGKEVIEFEGKIDPIGNPIWVHPRRNEDVGLISLESISVQALSRTKPYLPIEEIAPLKINKD